MKVGKLS